MSAQGRPAVDYSKTIRRSLADGKTLDQALVELRVAGSSIIDCIVSVRSVYGCDLIEAKRLVEPSDAWADVVAPTEADLRELTADDDAKV